MVKALYSIFLGALLAITINFAIQTFYPAASYPEYPTELQAVSEDLTAAQQSAQTEYDIKVVDYNKSSDTHAQVSLALALFASLILIAVGIFFTSPKFAPLYNGAAVGSVFLLYLTFIPSPYIIASKFNFFAALISLVIVKIIGLIKFVKLETK
ncbi:MAG: hypothetical protein WC227_04020 [Patescibacteria group bacterium]|jgi:hypothetical protein